MYQIIHPGGIFRFLHRLAIIIILRDLMGPENVPPLVVPPNPPLAPPNYTTGVCNDIVRGPVRLTGIPQSAMAHSLSTRMLMRAFFAKLL